MNYIEVLMEHKYMSNSLTQALTESSRQKKHWPNIWYFSVVVICILLMADFVYHLLAMFELYSQLPC